MPVVNPQDIRIVSVELEITNPSIASSFGADRSYSLGSHHLEDFDEQMKRLLDDTKVNDQVSLREFLGMKLQRDTAGLASLRANDPAPSQPAPRGEGGSHITMELWGPEGLLYRFVDDDTEFRFSGSQFSELRSVVVQTGTTFESAPESPYPESEETVKYPE